MVKQSLCLHIISICRFMLFTVNPVLSNNCKDMKGFLSNNTVLMASICAVGNPLLSPQDASSLSFLSLSHSVHPIMCSLHGPIYQAFSFLFVLAVPLQLQLFTTTE